MTITLIQARTLALLQAAITAWAAAAGAGATNVTANVSQTGEGLVCTIVFTPA